MPEHRVRSFAKCRRIHKPARRAAPWSASVSKTTRLDEGCGDNEITPAHARTKRRAGFAMLALRGFDRGPVTPYFLAKKSARFLSWLPSAGFMAL